LNIVNSYLFFGPSGNNLFTTEFGNQAIGEIHTVTSKIATFLNPSQELDRPRLESDDITFSGYPSPSWEAVAGLDLM
jgi:hypothetical protein